MKYWLLIMCGFATSLCAQTKVIEKYDYYTVAADSVNTLLFALNKQTPVVQNGAIFHGNTQYFLHTRFGWKKTGDQCQLTQVRTTLKLHYTMPRLGTAKKSVKAVWKQWYPQLKLHEKGHGELAKQIALDSDKKIQNIKAQYSCEAVQKEAYAITEQAKQRLRKSFITYDRITNHGQTQGAWLYAYL